MRLPRCRVAQGIRGRSGGLLLVVLLWPSVYYQQLRALHVVGVSAYLHFVLLVRTGFSAVDSNQPPYFGGFSPPPETAKATSIISSVIIIIMFNRRVSHKSI